MTDEAPEPSPSLANTAGGPPKGVRKARLLLARLLAQAFDERTLREFVSELPDGDELFTFLPGSHLATPVDIAHALIDAAGPRGILDDDFFRLLLETRPGLSAQINEIRQRSFSTEEPAGTITPGVILQGGRFQIETLLDSGAVASVWKAMDRHDGTHVAIKVLRRDMRDYELRRQQLIKGAKHLATIRHPRIARVIDPHFQEMGLDCCVLQFVPGESLAQVVKSQRLKAPQAIVGVIGDIGMGLAKLHPRVFHGDVSPKNIIIGADDHATLVDFDLVGDIDELPMTQATGAPGTDPYASPEWRTRSETVDARTDIFSLGMTAVYAFYGKRNLPAGLNDILAGNGPGPFIQNHLTCDPAIKAVLTRACELEVSRRYTSVVQFCNELRTALSASRKPLAVAPPQEVSPEPHDAVGGSKLSPAPMLRAAPPLRPPLALPTQPAPAAKPASSVSQSALPVPTSSATTSPPELRAVRDGAGPSKGRDRPAGAKRRRLAVVIGALLFATVAIWIIAHEEPTSAQRGDAVIRAQHDSGLSTEEMERSNQAIQTLHESRQSQAALQQILDDAVRSPRAVGQARLALAELMLMRAAACRMATSIDPAARDGQLKLWADQDLASAEALILKDDPAIDPDGQSARVRVLQALLKGEVPDAPQTAQETNLFVDSAPLWRDGASDLPARVLSGLQAIPAPSSLTQSVLALAQWRSGDGDTTRRLLGNILARADDHPFATTLLNELDRDDSTIKPGSTESSATLPDPDPVRKLKVTPGKKQPSMTPPVRKPPTPESEPGREPAPPTPVPLQTLAELKKKLREIGEACAGQCRKKLTDAPARASKLTIVKLRIELDDTGKINATSHGHSVDVPEAECLAEELTRLQLGPFEGPKTPFVESYSF